MARDATCPALVKLQSRFIAKFTDGIEDRASRPSLLSTLRILDRIIGLYNDYATEQLGLLTQRLETPESSIPKPRGSKAALEWLGIKDTSYNDNTTHVF